MSVLNELKKKRKSYDQLVVLNLVFLSAYYSAAKWTFIWDTEADSNRINLITGDRY